MGLINLLEKLTEVREALTVYQFLIKDIQINSQIKRFTIAKSERVPSTEVSNHVELECATLLACDEF